MSGQQALGRLQKRHPLHIAHESISRIFIFHHLSHQELTVPVRSEMFSSLPPEAIVYVQRFAKMTFFPEFLDPTARGARCKAEAKLRETESMRPVQKNVIFAQHRRKLS